MAEDFSNVKEAEEEGDSYGSERDTFVFWDVKRCPIPTLKHLKSVTSGMESALGKLGVYGGVHFNAYGDGMNYGKDDLYNAQVVYYPKGEIEIALGLIVCASQSCPEAPYNLVVVPKPDPDSEQHRVLNCLQSRGHDVFLVDEPDDGLFPSDSLSVQSVVNCTQALDGGKPIIRGRRMEDTPVIEDYASLIYLIERNIMGIIRPLRGSVRNALVFWDLKYTIPVVPEQINSINATLFSQSVGTSIRSALKQFGYHGCADIIAFVGDQHKQFRDYLCKAGIYCVPEGYHPTVLNWLAHGQWYPQTAALMVIPKPDPDSELMCLLERFSSTGQDVLLVQTPDDKDRAEYGVYLRDEKSVVDCTQGLDGKPIIRGTRMEEIQDFSKSIRAVNGVKATAGVFWNLEDFPFPDGWSPDRIYEKIQSAFRAQGYEDNMLIWVYVPDYMEESWGGDYFDHKTWKSSIYFLPGAGDRSVRRHRMLHDIHLWTTDLYHDRDYCPPELSIILVSDKDNVVKDKVFSSRLRVLIKSDYDVLVVTPTKKGQDGEWLASLSGDIFTPNTSKSRRNI